MKQSFTLTKLLTATMLVAALGAKAQSPTSAALGFNVFVKNNATLITNETEGPVAIGGDLNLNSNMGYQIATNDPGTFMVNGDVVGLVVGGKVNYNGGNIMQVNQNAYVKIGNSTGSYVWYVDQNNAYSPMRITPGQNYNNTPRIEMTANSQQLGVSATVNPVFQANVIDFATAFTTLKAKSTCLSTLADNATLTDANGTTIPHTNLPTQVKITLNNGMNVLNLNASDINNVQNFTFNQQPSSTKYLIINVNASGTFNWNVWTPGGFGGTAECKYILWNFYNTTTLNVQGGGQVTGTIFAPYADITKTVNQQNVEGQVIGQSYYHSGGENHPAYFTPSVTCSNTPTDAAFTVTSATTQCLSGNSFTFSNTSTGQGTITYLWSFGDGTTSTSTTPTKTYSATGTYTIKLKATSTSGSDSTTTSVTVNASPAQPGAFTASAATVYRGQTNVTYTVPTPPSGTLSFTYSGNGVTMTGTGNSRVLTFGQNATSGTLSVVTTGSNSCPSVARTLAITVKPYLTWTCGTNNSWSTATNWDGGFVPYSTISVIIPTGVCQPSITTGTPEVRTIINNSTVNIDCAANLRVMDSLINKGYIKGCGYVTLKGTTQQNVSGTNGKIDNFELDNCTNGAKLLDTLRIVKTYKPSCGTMVTNTKLVLQSDSTNGTATLLGNVMSCNYISGDIIVNKWIGGGRKAFRFFGHPFKQSIALNQLTPYIHITGAGGADSGFTTTSTNNPSAFWYNTLTGNGSAVNDNTGWITYKNTNGLYSNAWKPSQGARIYVRGTALDSICCGPARSTTIKMRGPVNQCDVIDTLKTNANYGYNFLGNPYAANVNMKLLVRGTNVGTNFSVWDPYQGTSGAYVSQPFNFDYFLPAYSAFITTCSGNTNNTIKFAETNKTASAASDTLFKTTTNGTFGSNALQLRITSENGAHSWDRLLMFFDGTTASTTEAVDGQKLSNPELDFYTFSSDNSKLSIDYRPFVIGEVVPLGLRATEEQDYAIVVEDLDVPSNGMVYLHDKFLNTVQPLTVGTSYSFTVTSDAASQGDNRFELNFADAVTSVETVVTGKDFNVVMVPNPATNVVSISWSATKAESQVIITNAVGQSVYSNTVAKGTHNISVPVNGLAQGMYLVTVITDGKTITKKLIKQ